MLEGDVSVRGGLDGLRDIDADGHLEDVEEIDGWEDADGLQLLAEQHERQDRHEHDELRFEEVDGHVDALQAGILEDETDFGDATLTNQIRERNLPTEHLHRREA